MARCSRSASAGIADPPGGVRVPLIRETHVLQPSHRDELAEFWIANAPRNAPDATVPPHHLQAFGLPLARLSGVAGASRTHIQRRAVETYSSLPAPDHPAGRTGASPLLRRSTSNPGLEVLRRSNGDAAARRWRCVGWCGTLLPQFHREERAGIKRASRISTVSCVTHMESARGLRRGATRVTPPAGTEGTRRNVRWTHWKYCSRSKLREMRKVARMCGRHGEPLRQPERHSVLEDLLPPAAFMLIRLCPAQNLRFHSSSAYFSRTRRVIRSKGIRSSGAVAFQVLLRAALSVRSGRLRFTRKSECERLRR